jgi:hypothetical protein
LPIGMAGRNTSAALISSGSRNVASYSSIKGTGSALTTRAIARMCPLA